MVDRCVIRLSSIHPLHLYHLSLSSFTVPFKFLTSIVTVKAAEQTFVLII
jgi:hypothetical protein